MPSFDPSPIPLARQPEIFIVARYKNPLTPTQYYMPLPNIVPLQIDRWVGAKPSTARFRYVFSPATLGSSFPAHVEDVLGLDKSGPYVVGQDDRICILKANADGSWLVRFDGYAQVPQGDFGPKTDVVTFEALGTECREWDTPIEGRIIRQGPEPTVVSTTSDVLTGLPARFNPDGEPNAVPTGSYSGADPHKYPVFFDMRGSPDKREYWSVPMCAQYISATSNAADIYVLDFPDYAVFAQLLDQRTPLGDGNFNPNNPNTYTSEQIIAHDLDITGDVWPDAIEKLLEPHGFGFYFRQSQDAGGFPLTTWNIYRNDGGDNLGPKQVYMQAPGSDWDSSQTNVNVIKISRDSSQIRNAVVLDTGPIQYEFSGILGPGFTINAADAAPASAKQFIEGDPGFTGANLDKYRVFIFGEGGDPWWSWAGSTMSTVIPSLDDILGSKDNNKGFHQYVNKRRKPIRELVTTDKKRKLAQDLLVNTSGNKLHAQLWLSTTYGTDQNGNPRLAPGIWDGTGGAPWWEVDGGWELLDDRIGIRLTLTDIRELKLKTPTKANVPNGGKINVLQSLAAPQVTGNVRFWFRLTCTIEGDQDLRISSGRRQSSTTKFTITRRIDTRDRFEKGIVCKSSIFNPNNNQSDYIAYDDTQNAQAYADAMRAAYEDATFSGSVTIPRWTGAYRLGDRLSAVAGRNISLRTNNGAEQGEAACYPMIVGITEDLDGGQRVHCHLADLRAVPPADHVKGGHFK